MRHKGNICHIARGYCAVTSLWPAQKMFRKNRMPLSNAK